MQYVGSLVVQQLFRFFPTGNSQNFRDNLECVGRYSFIQYIASAVCYRFQGPLNTGRYLGIRTIGSQILQLCEVEVYSRGDYLYSYLSDLQQDN